METLNFASNPQEKFDLFPEQRRPHLLSACYRVPVTKTCGHLIFCIWSASDWSETRWTEIYEVTEEVAQRDIDTKMPCDVRRAGGCWFRENKLEFGSLTLQPADVVKNHTRNWSQSNLNKQKQFSYF